MLPKWGASCFLIKGEGKGGFRSQVGGWLRWSADPLGGAESRGHMQYPDFALYTLLLFLTPQKWQLGSLGGLLVSFCPQFAPTAHAYT